MDAEDFEPEEFGVSRAVSLAFHGFDFVVRAFKGADRDRLVVRGKDSPGVEAERFGELLEHADAGRLGVHDPVHQEGLGVLLLVLVPDLVEFFLEVIGDGQELLSVCPINDLWAGI